MPTYEFRCMTCDNTTQIVSPIKTYSPAKYCTYCKSFTLKRIYAPTPAVFKGKGWGKDNGSN